jgi:hypothetical protein
MQKSAKFLMEKIPFLCKKPIFAQTFLLCSKGGKMDFLAQWCVHSSFSWQRNATETPPTNDGCVDTVPQRADVR